MSTPLDVFKEHLQHLNLLLLIDSVTVLWTPSGTWALPQFSKGNPSNSLRKANFDSLYLKPLSFSHYCSLLHDYRRQMEHKIGGKSRALLFCTALSSPQHHMLTSPHVNLPPLLSMTLIYFNSSRGGSNSLSTTVGMWWLWSQTWIVQLSSQQFHESNEV